MNPSEIKRLATLAAKHNPHPKTEYSKPFNFYLGCIQGDEDRLYPLFDQIISEIVAEEGRKNKRPAESRARFHEAVKLLILNMVQVRQLTGDNLLLAVPLNRNEYSLNARYSPPDMAYNQFKAAYDGLERLNYLKVVHRGYRFAEAGDAMRTRISGTGKLFRAIDKATKRNPLSFIRHADKRPDEIIILKDAEKKRIDYTDTAFTKKARSMLERINTALSQHEYALPLSAGQEEQLRRKLISNHSQDVDHASPYIDFQAVRLYRIFNDGQFNRGGRFYGGWWQSVPEVFRQFITIDDQKTVELDYSRFHISILYAELGMKPVKDAYAIHPHIDEAVTKHAVNALISAKGKPKPVDGFNARQAGISWDDFIGLIKRKHAPLHDADMFMNGYGLSIQFKDSELAQKVLLHFIDQGIPCLPIHDSFIIQKNKGVELRDIMLKLYKDTFGQDIKIK